MSVNAISASAVLPAANFHPHGRHRGTHVDTGTTSGTGSIVGQLPVGATTGLFGSLLQSLERAVGTQSAASTGAAATGTAAATPLTGSSAANAATSNLTAAFNQLVNGVNGGAAIASTSSNSTLQHFLTTLLQNLQTNGVQSPSSIGAHVNAEV